ncbi:MAG: molecular chaperone DnaJ [Elusimicrobia bacterium]|nr:molecular chaperone DnaJ [Elusimicrobiota bacterium]MBU2614117.1 molecular chaperone DnaJ [Elusimicrobiota bacterium]
MSTKKDYYEVLGIAKTAQKTEIEQAYRKLAVQYHPDRVAPDKKEEARERFKEITEAYAVLFDDNKRKLYDQYGHAGIDGNYTNEDIFRGVNFDNIFHDMGGGRGGNEDFFGTIFDFFGNSSGRSAGRSRKGPGRGSDLEIPQTVTLEEAYKGVEKPIQYYKTETCNTCKGTGAEPRTTKKICPVCRGTGQQTASMGGYFTFSQPCQKCHGEGEIIEIPCGDCKGRGKVRKSEQITVKIPKGVDNGTSIRVRGKGEAGERGGPGGDLYVSIRVQPDNNFERKGDDLYTEVKIPFPIAALGGEADVPTFEDKLRMKIPPGTQSNKNFRIKEKGMPNVHTEKQGDFYVQVIIDVPTKLTELQKEILREFNRTLNK